MVRKALALAVAGMISLSAPAFAADAQASASKAAAKVVKVERQSAPMGAANELTGRRGGGMSQRERDYWLFILFGIVAGAITYDAIIDDKDPVSP